MRRDSEVVSHGHQLVSSRKRRLVILFVATTYFELTRLRADVLKVSFADCFPRFSFSILQEERGHERRSPRMFFECLCQIDHVNSSCSSVSWCSPDSSGGSSPFLPFRLQEVSL